MIQVYNREEMHNILVHKHVQERYMYIVWPY